MCYRYARSCGLVKQQMDKHPRFASKKIYEKLDDSFLDGILIRHQTCPEDEGHNQIG